MIFETNEPKITILLNTIHDFIKVGMDKNDLILTTIVKALDELTDEVIQQNHYIPCNLIELSVSAGTAKIDELNKLEQAMLSDPACGIILGISTLCKNVKSKLQTEIGGFPMELKFSGSLDFYISGNRIGYPLGSSLSPHEEKKEREKILQSLEKLGFTWDKESELNSIKNIEVMESYLKGIGVTHVSFEISEKQMQKIQCKLNPAEYSWFSIKVPNNAKDSDVLSEADVYDIRKNIKGYLEAIEFSKNLNDDNLILGLFCRYMALIEKRLGYSFLVVKDTEAQTHKNKSDNLTADQYERELGESYFAAQKENFCEYFSKMSDCIEGIVKPLGFVLTDVSIGERGSLMFKCVPNFFVGNLSNDLDCKHKESSCQVYFTERNRKIIRTALRNYLPHAQVTEYQVNDEDVIKSFDVVSLSFTDLITVFKKS